MADLLRPYVQARPDEPAITDERGITTWREFDARVDRLAGALRGLGLVSGDAIAIHSRNRREYFELMMASAHIGLRYVLVNWHWTADELKYVLADSGAKAIFSEDAFAEVAAEAAADTAVPRRHRGGAGLPAVRGVPGRRTGRRAGRSGHGLADDLHVGDDGAAQGRAAQAGGARRAAGDHGDRRGGVRARSCTSRRAAGRCWSGRCTTRRSGCGRYGLLCAGRSVVMRRAFDAEPRRCASSRNTASRTSTWCPRSSSACCGSTRRRGTRTTCPAWPPSGTAPRPARPRSSGR